MNIIQDFIPVGRPNRPGRKLTPEYITIHDTGNNKSGANARAHASYLKGADAANAQVSWHFTVDDKEAVQHLPLDEIGWHAGDSVGNHTSIGVEICENSDGDRAKAEINAAELVAKLLQQFGLSIGRVVQHNHWSGKDCPHILRSKPGAWEGFINQVKTHLKTPTEFPDVPPDHWAAMAVARVVEAGIMGGYPDGNFHGQSFVTRYELASALDRVLQMIRQE